MKKLLYLFFFCISALSTQCVSTENTSSHIQELHTLSTIESLPTRNDLRATLDDKGKLLIAYATSDALSSDDWISVINGIADQLPAYGNRKVKITPKEISEVTESDIRTKAILLLGSHSNNTLIPRLTKNLPMTYTDSSFTFHNSSLDQRSEIVSLANFHNPENQNNPIYCITGNNDIEVYNYVKEKGQSDKPLFNRRMDFEIFRSGEKIITGAYNRQWQIDTATYFDYSKKIDTILTSKQYRYISHHDNLSQEAHKNIIDKVESESQHIISFIGVEKSIPMIDYHIYHSAEQKGLLLGNTLQAHYDIGRNAVYTIHNQAYENNYIQKENNLIIYHLMGTPAARILNDGFSIYFTKQWQRKGYQYWSARLSESGNALSLTELFDDENIRNESDLIKDCLTGSMVAYLIDLWGKEKFLQKYSSWNPNQEELHRLEDGWITYLQKLELDYPKKKRSNQSTDYVQGFNFAHEGYNIYNGYLSTMATKAIEKQASLGCNSIALVPYTSMRDIHKPVPFHFSRWAGGENDQGMVHSAHQAKKLGMTTMLKPQVWVSGSWPGDIEMKNEEDWNLFFDYYHKWIRHYAFLAEIHEIEMFCIGVEFSKATLAHPDDWRKIVSSIRGLYQGQITYAANWGEEFENGSFFEALDFIGLNCYYPLSPKENPSKGELKKNFSKVKSKIRKVSDAYNKPIMLTEIGFRSTTTPWKNPHAEGNNTYSEEAQQLCYEVVYESIENEEWCNGILWWKFPTYLDYGAVGNNAFTPNKKKAEMTVKKWFAKSNN